MYLGKLINYTLIEFNISHLSVYLQFYKLLQQSKERFNYFTTTAKEFIQIS